DLRGRRIAAARAAAIGIGVVGRRRDVRFALVEIGVLMASRSGGRGGDGRRASAACHSFPTRTRAAHRILEFK
ncbi:hypothetical protein, partial [Achromobacter animicus]|uniref:hypothetical protein n=1 Tax=Achromobacter animicus TaxID=1389935 RepID=UPI0028B0485C